MAYARDLEAEAVLEEVLTDEDALREAAKSETKRVHRELIEIRVRIRGNRRNKDK